MLPRFAGFEGQLTVDFSTATAATFASHQQHRFWQNERGGVLLASSVGATDGYVEVMEATPPHRLDRAGWSWLELNQARVLSNIHDGFARGLHFVGYWHTHPEAHPRLSSQDVAAMMPVIRGADLDLLRVVMVVVGGNRDVVKLDVCVIERATSAITRLRPDGEPL